ncbi:hypothetical protein PENTCL1PPCAC_20184, partial [Pristionchus entomophagus]
QSYVRWFGIYSTLLALIAVKLKATAAVQQALIHDGFAALMTDHLLISLCAATLCFFSMIFVAISFKKKLDKLLYGPILVHFPIVNIIQPNISNILDL